MRKYFVVSLAIIMFVSFVSAKAIAHQTVQCIALFKDEKILLPIGRPHSKSGTGAAAEASQNLMTLSDRISQFVKDEGLTQKDRDEAELALKVLRLSTELNRRFGERLDLLPSDHPNTKLIRGIVKMYFDDLQMKVDAYEANAKEIKRALSNNENDLAELFAQEQPKIIESIIVLINKSTIRHTLYSGSQRVGNHVILEIHGHNDALNRLVRMYKKLADKNGWKFEELDKDESGAVFEIRGDHALTFLSLESGKHKVVRQDGSTHQQEALVQAYKPVDASSISKEKIEREIKFQPTLASGAGGQHIQKNKTAVHAIHKPSGLQVKVQVERSQQANKDLAVAIIYSKIKDQADRQRQDEQASARRQSADRGQRRSPYQRIYRLDGNSQLASKLLDGHIDETLNVNLFRAQVDYIEALIQLVETGNILRP